MIDFDARVNCSVSKAFGEEFLYEHKSGLSYPVTGVFHDGFRRQVFDSDGTPAMATSDPFVGVRMVELRERYGQNDILVRRNRRAVSDCRAAAGWYGLDQFQTEGECMTTSVDLRLLAVDALKDATTAGANVYNPRDLATWDGDYPMLVVTAPQDGQGLGRIGAPQFNVTTTLRVLGRVQRAAEEDDLAAAKLYEDLEALRIRSSAPSSTIQPSWGCYSSIHSSGQRSMRAAREDSGLHQGQVVVDIGMEFSKGPMSSIRSPTGAVGGPGAGPHARGTEFPGATINLPQ